MTSCSAVTEEHLAQVTGLDGISVYELPETGVAGLSNLESLTLELQTETLYFEELVNLKRLDITFNPAKPAEHIRRGKESKATHAMPQGTNKNPFMLDELKVTINPWHPDSNAIDSSGFFSKKFRARKTHIIDRQRGCYGLITQQLPIGYLRWNRHPDEIIIEFDPITIEHIRYKSVTTAGGDQPWEPWLSEVLPRKLTIINHNEEIKLSASDEFIVQAGRRLTHIELRGFDYIDDYAFAKLQGIETLHLDPKPDGKPHELQFPEGFPPPKGTGFVVRD